MLSRLVRYLVTLTVLLTLTVAGLPALLCISDVHGAAIEVGRHHSQSDSGSGLNHANLGDAKHAADPVPCVDIRFDHVTLRNQSRDRQSAASAYAPNHVAPPVAIISAPRLYARSLPAVAPAAFEQAKRSSLSDLRTIVLLI